MRKCEYCGAEIDESEDRCPNCGAPAPAAVEEEPPKEPEIPESTSAVETPAAPAGTTTKSESDSSGFVNKAFACIVIFVLFIIIVGTLVSGSDTYDVEAAKEIHVEFMNAFDKAVNNGNISEIDPYVVKDSSAYKYLKNLFASRRNTVSVQAWNHINVGTEYNPQEDMIEITSIEKYQFRYKAGGVGLKDYFVIYYVEPQSPYRIKRIEQWKDPYTDWQPGIVTSDNVNIRTTPELRDGNVATQVNHGDFIKVYPTETESADGITWLRIRHEKCGLGWISSEYAEYDPVCTQ